MGLKLLGFLHPYDFKFLRVIIISSENN